MGSTSRTVSPSPGLNASIIRPRVALLARPVVRIVLATLASAVPVALVLILANVTLEQHMRIAWPPLLAALLCVAGYRLYVKRIEKREAVELALPGAAREITIGLAAGVALSVAVIGLLAAADVFHIEGYSHWSVVFRPVPELVLVALFEEILFRAILFRMIEGSLGTRSALAISMLLFALAHLPNEGITVLGVLVTAMAGLLFCAAYLATRRLWLPVGIHFAWNYMSDAIFSLPVSGHPARGWVQGRLTGPDWLSGGAYGVEASAATLVVITATSLYLLSRAARDDRSKSSAG